MCCSLMLANGKIMCLADARMCCSLKLANVSPSAKEATTGAMRARTDVDGVYF